MVHIKLEPRICPICEGKVDQTLFAESNVDLEAIGQFAFASRKLPEYMHWRLLLCQTCDLVYADPAPSPETLASLYRDAAFDTCAEAGHASQTYAQFLPAILEELPDLDAAADIGTGDGAFLYHLLQSGFQRVIGVEPSTAPIQAASPEIAPLILNDIFQPDTLEASSISLISCFQTIEHLPDPLAFCKAAWTALKPGGALFLICHDRRALSAKILGFRSPIYDIEHLQLFSPVSVRCLVEASGFERVKIQSFLNRYPLNYWVRLFPFPQFFKDSLLAGISRTGVGKLKIPMPAGNLAIVAFKSR